MPTVEYVYIDPNTVINDSNNRNSCNFDQNNPNGGHPAFPDLDIQARNTFNPDTPYFNLPYLGLSYDLINRQWYPDPIAVRDHGNAFNRNGNVRECPFSLGEWWNIETLTSTMNLATNVQSPWDGYHTGLIRSIKNFCVNDSSSFRAMQTGNETHMKQTPLVNPANRLIDPSERGGLGYFMGMIFNVLVASKAGYTFIIHLSLLDKVVPPDGQQGSQYGNRRPDLIALTVYQDVNGNHWGRIHILEAKGSMAETPWDIGPTMAAINGNTVRGKLAQAMSQCNSFTQFITPNPNINQQYRSWGLAGFIVNAAAGQSVQPASRVATVANIGRNGRWRVWVTDPNEEVDPAPTSFTDDYLRVFYAQYLPYFLDDLGWYPVYEWHKKAPVLSDRNSLVREYKIHEKKLSLTHGDVYFLTVQIDDHTEVGIDTEIIYLLMNEPKGGYDSLILDNLDNIEETKEPSDELLKEASLTALIAGVLKKYEQPWDIGDAKGTNYYYDSDKGQSKEIYNVYISREGILTARTVPEEIDEKSDRFDLDALD